MSESPLFNRIDADRILRRAADIEGSEESDPLSIEELRAIAGEAGFGARAVERAIAEALQTGPMGARRNPVQKRGILVTRLSTSRTIPIELSSEQLLRAVRLFQPYREGPAQVSLGEQQITWRDRKGLSFNVMSSGGQTEIRVYVARILLRKGRWMGWVKSAADRLEALIFLVATRAPSGVGSVPVRSGTTPGQLEPGPRPGS
jgi:hypothetical protein